MFFRATYMYETSDFRKNLKILLDGVPYAIVDFQHVKPGKGNQFTRTKLKNLLTRTNLERTFKSGEKFEVPDIRTVSVNFLYKDDSGFHFMDQTHYDQFLLTADKVGEASKYLIENLEIVILMFNEKPVGIDLPKAINLKITQTDPGFKGNTVANTNKPATLETGVVVQVPLHINEGDTIRVDTRTGEYVERVKG